MLLHYFAVSVIFAAGLVAAIRRMKRTGIVILILFFSLNLYSQWRAGNDLADRRPTLENYHAAVRYLDQQNVAGGYADYWVAYVITFLSQEKITLAPYMSQDRYPQYTKKVELMKRKAYLFNDTDSQLPGFEAGLQADRKVYTKQRFGQLSVFILGA
jgi:hypothetical protein